MKNKTMVELFYTNGWGVFVSKTTELSRTIIDELESEAVKITTSRDELVEFVSKNSTTEGVWVIEDSIGYAVPH